jgi:hypothetical protein
MMNLHSTWRRALMTTGTSALALSLTLQTACGPTDTGIGPRTRTSPTLKSYENCASLETELKSTLKEEMRTRLLQAEQDQLMWSMGNMRSDDLAAPTAMAGAESDSGAPRQEGVDYSGTNNQESGVDEADFVKTDGYYIYALRGSVLEILGVPTFGELTHVSTLPIEGYPRQMLLDGDRAVVFSDIYTWDLPAEHPLRSQIQLVDSEWGSYYRTHSLVKLSVVDLSTDRLTPTVVREVFIEGYLNTGREVDGIARLVTMAFLDVPGLTWWPNVDYAYWDLSPLDPARRSMLREATERAIAENNAVIDAASLDDFVPNLFDVKASDTGTSIERVRFAGGSCDNFLVAGDGTGHGFTSMLSVDLRDDVIRVDATHIRSNWSTIYASTDTLLVTEPANDWWWYWNNDRFDEATNIHRFDITAATPQYTGSGRVDGSIMGQFALSEHEGYVRVASTTGRFNRWWLQEQDESENHIFVLGGENTLNTLGRIHGIARGERIWSARFVGDKGYIVTFRDIDPLFTIDLSDPTAPRILGELKIPGVSTYIHPLEGERLLTIGMGGDDEGLDWGAIELSLFDVSTPAAPTRASVMPVTLIEPAQRDEGWYWSWSEAAFQHKAFQYWDPKKLLAIPMSSYRSFYNERDGYYGYEYKTVLKLVKVGENALVSYGEVDHSGFYTGEGNSYYWSYGVDVRRSIFMGDYIYAISNAGVTCTRLEDLTETARVAFPSDGGYTPYY